MSVQAFAHSESEVRAWLVDAIRARQKEAITVDPTEPFETYGIDSVERMGLAYELEVWLGVRLPEEVLVSHDSIESLTRYLFAS